MLLILFAVINSDIVNICVHRSCQLIWVYQWNKSLKTKLLARTVCALKILIDRGFSVAAHWLRLCAPNVGGPGSIPDQETRAHIAAAKIKDPVCHN